MILFTDQIKLRTVTENQETGERVQSAQVTYPAYIEASSEVRYEKNGTPYKVNYLIFLPKDCVIKEGDMIGISRQFAQNVSVVKEYKVRHVQKCGFLSLCTHLEVEV